MMFKGRGEEASSSTAAATTTTYLDMPAAQQLSPVFNYALALLGRPISLQGCRRVGSKSSVD